MSTLTLWADDVTAAADWYADLLGAAPYFTRPGPGGGLQYAKFRTGDLDAEVAIAHRSFDPAAAAGPGGAIVHWHVDDFDGTLARLLAAGATEYQPVTPHGPVVTAAVTDPFGNVIGIMHNPHYLEVLDRTDAAPAAAG
ncbi:VOC family protein [Trujillonella endophytica]|nr:VOC family protein [Trujillella endophytica]